jgi:hypothetical protein
MATVRGFTPVTVEEIDDTSSFYLVDGPADTPGDYSMTMAILLEYIGDALPAEGVGDFVRLDEDGYLPALDGRNLVNVPGGGGGGGGGAVDSVNGLTGVVTLDAESVGAAEEEHTHPQSDVTGLVAALDAKAPLASPTFTGTVAGITATMVGLGNVNNTSDASKPVSTAQQTALDLKLNTADLAAEVEAAFIDATGAPDTGTFFPIIVDDALSNEAGGEVESSTVWDYLTDAEGLTVDSTLLAGLRAEQTITATDESGTDVIEYALATDDDGTSRMRSLARYVEIVQDAEIRFAVPDVAVTEGYLAGTLRVLNDDSGSHVLDLAAASTEEQEWISGQSTVTIPADGEAHLVWMQISLAGARLIVWNLIRVTT